MFAAWLLSSFGQARLREGCGVVDIAGGGGLLSFELAVRYGIDSTVLDPRIIKLSSMLRRKMKKLTKNRTKLSPDSTRSRMEDHCPLFQSLMNCHSLSVTDDGVVTHLVSEAIEDAERLPFHHRCQQFEIDTIADSNSIISLCTEASIL